MASNIPSPGKSLDLQSRLYRYGGGQTQLIQTPRRPLSGGTKAHYCKESGASPALVRDGTAVVVPHTNVRPMGIMAPSMNNVKICAEMKKDDTREKSLEKEQVSPSKYGVYSGAKRPTGDQQKHVYLVFWHLVMP